MRKLSLFFGVIVVIQFAIQPAQVFAQFDQQFYSGNNIQFSNPTSLRCAPNETLADTNIRFTRNTTIDRIRELLTSTPISTNNDMPLSEVQVAGIMGNMYAESAFKTDAIEVTDREDKGHGLVQWTFGRWDALQKFADSQNTEWTDLDTQIRFLERELETTESAIFNDEIFNNSTQPSDTAVRFRIIFERADPTQANDPKRTGAAIAIYDLYNQSTTSNCVAANGAVAGNLVKTAINFALEQPADLNGQVRNTQADARDTYQEAKPRLNPTVDWTDCGGYIATAMYASGVDMNFPNVWLESQINYIRSNTDKYIVIENPTLGDLQPGDILFTSGHSTLYTGEDTYPSVDASLNERVPSVRSAGSAVWMINNGAVVARIIQ